MIGAAKMVSVSEITPAIPYGVNLNPGSINVFSENGAASSPLVTSDVVSGVGPFTYQWTITGSDITINSPTNSSTRFNASGFFDFYSEVATLTVTDTGNSNAETSKDINVVFAFENINL